MLDDNKYFDFYSNDRQPGFILPSHTKHIEDSVWNIFTINNYCHSILHQTSIDLKAIPEVKICQSSCQLTSNEWIADGEKRLITIFDQVSSFCDNYTIIKKEISEQAENLEENKNLIKLLIFQLKSDINTISVDIRKLVGRLVYFQNRFTNNNSEMEKIIEKAKKLITNNNTTIETLKADITLLHKEINALEKKLDGYKAMIGIGGISGGIGAVLGLVAVLIAKSVIATATGGLALPVVIGLGLLGGALGIGFISGGTIAVNKLQENKKNKIETLKRKNEMLANLNAENVVASNLVEQWTPLTEQGVLAIKQTDDLKKDWGDINNYFDTLHNQVSSFKQSDAERLKEDLDVSETSLQNIKSTINKYKEMKQIKLFNPDNVWQNINKKLLALPLSHIDKLKYKGA